MPAFLCSFTHSRFFCRPAFKFSCLVSCCLDLLFPPSAGSYPLLPTSSTNGQICSSPSLLYSSILLLSCVAVDPHHRQPDFLVFLCSGQPIVSVLFHKLCHIGLGLTVVETDCAEFLNICPVKSDPWSAHQCQIKIYPAACQSCEPSIIRYG